MGSELVDKGKYIRICAYVGCLCSGYYLCIYVRTCVSMLAFNKGCCSGHQGSFLRALHVSASLNS